MTILKKVREQVMEDISALFLITKGVIDNKAADRLKSVDYEIISSFIDEEQEINLRNESVKTNAKSTLFSN